jgi:xanthine/CO dehydrogenase XdhC/CoxF family maturation factor
MSNFRIGAWCWIVTGTGHTLIDISTRIFASDADEFVDGTLRARSFGMLGLRRSLYDVSMGVSLSMGLTMVCVGVLLLHIHRLTPRQDLRTAATLGLAMSAAALAISVWLEPPPPIVFFSVACVAFGLAARSSGRLTPDDDARATATIRGR